MFVLTEDAKRLLIGFLFAISWEIIDGSITHNGMRIEGLMRGFNLTIF